VIRTGGRDGARPKRSFAVVVTVGVLLLLGAANSHAKLVFRADDVYVVAAHRKKWKTWWRERRSGH
jgi:hypothetical protein